MCKLFIPRKLSDLNHVCIKSFLDGLAVGGGGDVAEDIAGALLKVTDSRFL